MRICIPNKNCWSVLSVVWTISLSSPGSWFFTYRFIFLHFFLLNYRFIDIEILYKTGKNGFYYRYLDLMMIDGPQLRKQYRLSILTSVLGGHPENMQHTLQYLSRNLRKIIDTWVLIIFKIMIFTNENTDYIVYSSEGDFHSWITSLPLSQIESHHRQIYERYVHLFEDYPFLLDMAKFVKFFSFYRSLIITRIFWNRLRIKWKLQLLIFKQT